MPTEFDLLAEPAITSETTLGVLRAAWDAARSCELDPWEFAVGIGEMWRAGVSETELRSLLARGLAEHANEVTQPKDGARRFQPVKSLALSESACFVITDEGRRLAARHSNGHARRKIASRSERALLKPFWDAKRRELWLGDVLVKRFTRPAPLQELILAAFQEQGWPAVIDDPLPGKKDANQRLRRWQAAANLNRSQDPLRIRFTADARQQTISWQVLRQHSGKQG